MSATEIIHRNELTTLLLRQGYNVFIPGFDEGKPADRRQSVPTIHSDNHYVEKAPA